MSEKGGWVAGNPTPHHYHIILLNAHLVNSTRLSQWIDHRQVKCWDRKKKAFIFNILILIPYKYLMID